jgi:hypothetical protein
MRDNKYLENLLYDIWENHFCDVPRTNVVTIKYGKFSKRQLGCIRLIKDKATFERYVKKLKIEEQLFEYPSISLITLTKYYTLPIVPDFVIKSTIAHELCHYTHGFNSPLEQLYRHPHRGGVIRKEFRKRDLLDIYTESKQWLKENWITVVS